MSDNNMESVPTSGAQGAPIPEASPAGGQSPSAIDVKSIAEALRPIIQEEVARSGQSVKDKRIAKLQDDVDKALARYDELLKEGLTPQRARRELALDQLLESRQDNSDSAAPTQQAVGSRPAQAALDHTALLSSLGLDPNSPEVLAVAREGGDTATQIIKFANLATQKAKAQPQPNPAQQVPVGGGTSVSDRTLEDVEADLANIKKKPGHMGTKQYRDIVEEHRRFLLRP